MSESGNRRPAADLDDRRAVTSEVGDEGGSPGDVEIDIDRLPGVGREADETVQPVEEHHDVTVRDETGVGRRSP